MQIHQFDSQGYWTGSSREIGRTQVIPAGWTPATLPAEIPEGQFARLISATEFGLTDVPPQPSAEPPALVSMRVDTPLFIMRFTPHERVAMRAAAKADNEYAPLIDDWLAILNDPRLAYVELDDPNLVAAMGMMVDLGLVTQERADQVMAP